MIKQEDQKVDIVIAADTVVSIDGDILEKPKDSEDALQILKKLNGRSHRVYTGIAFIYPSTEPVHPGYNIVSFTEETEVIFRECNEEDFKAYIETGEPMDKAGGYGYQALGSFFVEKINGYFYKVLSNTVINISILNIILFFYNRCYYNVVGFPT